MANCKPCSTLVDTSPKLAADDCPPVSDATHFWSLAGALQYLTFTRPDIAYAVQQICLHMHDPVMKRIIRYVRGKADYGLQLHPSSPIELVVYSDADWA